MRMRKRGGELCTSGLLKNSGKDFLEGLCAGGQGWGCKEQEYR